MQPKGAEVGDRLQYLQTGSQLAPQPLRKFASLDSRSSIPELHVHIEMRYTYISLELYCDILRRESYLSPLLLHNTYTVTKIGTVFSNLKDSSTTFNPKTPAFTATASLS
ncbi:hypothetical protein KC19_12G149500 [Ceratodon purpureus]|uniref:Uncharacterized protein n=1 Tax=Ceratodon purpureus TaxID=3225 RepID=A0A8T0G808_CERPU|nr:hypothetical protein KC19_12G149500 [Ceratodon purpureus]